MTSVTTPRIMKTAETNTTRTVYSEGVGFFDGVGKNPNITTPRILDRLSGEKLECRRATLGLFVRRPDRNF
jgi:hypothetical protein